MALQEVHLDDEEQIIRVFARSKSQLKRQLVKEPGDFSRERYMSGISLWRASARAQAISAWGTSWPKGTLICTAGELRVLGLRFYRTANEDHFTVRCDGCDLNPNQRAESLQGLALCKKSDLTNCDLVLGTNSAPGHVTPLGILDQMAKIFRWDTKPSLRQ